MATMPSDHGAGSFRSQSPPSRISDSGDHDLGMLNETGHIQTPQPQPHNSFGPPPNSAGLPYRIMPEADTDRGF